MIGEIDLSILSDNILPQITTLVELKETIQKTVKNNVNINVLNFL